MAELFGWHEGGDMSEEKTTADGSLRSIVDVP
jgi:hypothetical protein